MKTEAEIGVTLPHAKEFLGPPSRKRRGRVLPSADTQSLYLQLPELGDDDFMAFDVTQFAVLCSGNSKKPTGTVPHAAEAVA